MFLICNTVKKLQSNISLVLEKKDISAAELTSRGTYVKLEKRRMRRVSFKETDKQGCERRRVKPSSYLFCLRCVVTGSAYEMIWMCIATQE